MRFSQPTAPRRSRLPLHGTDDGPIDGGGPNTRIVLAREFEAALRREGKPVEAHYYTGGSHASFFTDARQHAAELTAMIDFLRRRLGP